LIRRTIESREKKTENLAVGSNRIGWRLLRDFEPANFRISRALEVILLQYNIYETSKLAIESVLFD
jgi:hypothetical protein